MPRQNHSQLKDLHHGINDPDPKITSFLYPFIRKGKINSTIVVGSPDPHGPYQVRGRDGHYGMEIAAFLGQHGLVSQNLLTKLDVEIKSENKLSNSLILIGGPLTNTITSDFNKYFQVKFKEQFPFHGIYSEKPKKPILMTPLEY